jgi:transcriptional regulator with XRE-family HTH domain
MTEHFSAWIPKTILALRTTKGLTQRELAERSGYRNGSVISDFENGRTVPSLQGLDRIFTALGVMLTISFDDIDKNLDSDWIYVKKDTLRKIVEMVEEINPIK